MGRIRAGSSAMRTHSAALGARYRMDASVKEARGAWKYAEVV